MILNNYTAIHNNITTVSKTKISKKTITSNFICTPWKKEPNKHEMTA
jgi:hypothetical protein